MSGSLGDERKTSADELPEQQADLVWVARLSRIGDDVHYSANANPPPVARRNSASRSAMPNRNQPSGQLKAKRRAGRSIMHRQDWLNIRVHGRAANLFDQLADGIV